MSHARDAIKRLGSRAHTAVISVTRPGCRREECECEREFDVLVTGIIHDFGDEVDVDEEGIRAVDVDNGGQVDLWPTEIKRAADALCLSGEPV